MDTHTNDVPTTGSVPRGRWTLAVGLVAIAALLMSCGSDDPDGTTAASTATTAVEADHSDDEHDDDEDDHDDEEHDDEEDHDDEDEHDDHDDDSSGLGAHEHGTAELSVAWIEADVVVDLVSPVQNIFGFEYEPKSDEDLAIADERTEALLKDGTIVVNADANCALSEPASMEVERDGSHSEATVSWSFTCQNPDDISELDLSGLFDEFPGFEDIDAEWVSASEQSSAELSPEQPTLRLMS